MNSNTSSSSKSNADAPIEAMAFPELVEPLDEAALQILEAASKRFLHYGYNKTTMSEIAKDCNMSTGNLYRFFPSKLDIAEGFVKILRTEQMSKLRLALHEPNLTAAERLRNFFKTKLSLTYNRFHDRPKAYELSTVILRERKHFAVEWADAEARLMGEIISMGIDEGVFPEGDTFEQAHLIQNAFYRFTMPTLFLDGEFEDLAVELDALISLILDGLAVRARGGDSAQTKMRVVEAP